MEDDNIFDDDNALDYIIYEDASKENPQKTNGGCFALLVVFLIPLCVFKVCLLAL